MILLVIAWRIAKFVFYLLLLLLLVPVMLALLAAGAVLFAIGWLLVQLVRGVGGVV